MAGRDPTDEPIAAEVVARLQVISDRKALKRHFSEMFKHGQPRYADFYDASAEPWNLWLEMVPDFIEGWQTIDFDDDRPRSTKSALALTLSMPAGIDPITNEAAALAVARREFRDRQYVWIVGDHAGPFVKFLVEYRDGAGRALLPGPADLHRYRETYVEELGRRGILARATTRSSRGLDSSDTRVAYKAHRRLHDAAEE